MDGVYNIQVLLRAAEFLERRERGKERALTTIVCKLLFQTTKSSMGKRRFYTRMKRPLGNLFRAHARESAEIVSGRLFWGFSLFDWVTYISVGSLYSKAPIWSGLKMSRWCLRFLPQWEATALESNHCLHALRSVARIRVREGANSPEIAAETVCDGAKTEQCPAGTDDSSLLRPPSKSSA